MLMSRRRWRIGLASILHTSAAALGFSAILATSASALLPSNCLVGYLILLGIKMLLARGKHLSLPCNFARAHDPCRVSSGHFYKHPVSESSALFSGVSSAIHDPSCTTKVVAFVALGLTFVTSGTIKCLTLACFAATFSESLRANERLASEGASGEREIGPISRRSNFRGRKKLTSFEESVRSISQTKLTKT